jgi:DegV family protein with EDD domain
MSKICIVADSSVGLLPEQAKKANIEIAPLSIFVDEKEHKDFLDILPQDIIQALKDKKSIKTSQPNLGFLDEMMARLKKENFDHIIVFSIASYLSGTYSAFDLAAKNNELTNITIVDTKTAAAPILHVALEARKMADAGKSVEEILEYANRVVEDSKTYILVDTMDQLVRGGRVKGSVAALINLLKVRLGLSIQATSTTIDRFATARTEAKLFAEVINDMKKRGVTPETHVVYLPECEATGRLEAFKKQLDETMPGFEVSTVVLPAGITAHVGLNAFGIQAVLKA